MKVNIYQDLSNKEEKPLNFIMLLITYLGLWTFILDSAYFSENLLRVFRNFTVAIGTFYFISVFLISEFIFKKKISVRIPTSKTGFFILVLWFVFSFSIMISELVNGKLSSNGMSYIFFVFSIFIYIIPMTLEKPIETILRATLFSSIIILIVSLLIEPISSNTLYSGITLNPNSMGLLSTQIANSCVVFIYLNVSQRSLLNIQNTFLFMLYLLALSIILISGSRTSLLISLFSALIIVFKLIYNKKIKFYQVFIVLILFLMIYNFWLEEYFNIGVGQKILSRESSGVDLLAGRGNIWTGIINNAKIFGYGNEYYDGNMLAAHNDVLHFTAMYGYITGITLFLLYLMTLIQSFKFTKNNIRLSIVPLIIVVSFITLSTFESVFGFYTNPVTMIFFSYIGILVYKEKKLKSQVHNPFKFYLFPGKYSKSYKQD